MVAKKVTRSRQDNGFTLLEILVVVFILGVLSAIVVVALSGAIGSGQKKACETDLSAVQSALLAYDLDNPSTKLPNTKLYFTISQTPDDGSLADLGYIAPLRPQEDPPYTITLQFPNASATVPVAKVITKTGAVVNVCPAEASDY